MPTSFKLIAFFGSVIFGCFSMAEEFDVVIGTSGANGIYGLVLDSETGAISEPNKLTDLEGAGFLTTNRSGTRLYSTGKIDSRGCVVGFNVNRGENRELILSRNSVQKVPGGHHPTHINVDQTDRFLFSAQYGGGTICSFKLEQAGVIGALIETIQHRGGSKVVVGRQNGPHPHWIGTDASNSILAVPDLGLDQVACYKLNGSNGKLTKDVAWDVPPGSGPRHMKFHPNGKFAYVLNEFTLTVSVFFREAPVDSFTKIQDVRTLPDPLKDKRLNAAAEIRIHPNGQFVYTSNRGHDSLAVFSIDEVTGGLTFLQRVAIRGSWPRNFNVSPCGNWLIAAGKHSNTLSVFEVGADGRLEFTRAIKNAPGPICVEFIAR